MIIVYSNFSNFIITNWNVIHNMFCNWLFYTLTLNSREKETPNIFGTANWNIRCTFFQLYKVPKLQVALLFGGKKWSRFVLLLTFENWVIGAASCIQNPNDDLWTLENMHIAIANYYQEPILFITYLRGPFLLFLYMQKEWNYWLCIFWPV